MTRRLIALLSLLFGGAALVGPARGQTISEALAAAYLNNPTLEAERAGLRATDEQVPQALSNWRPEVDLEGDVTRSDTFSSEGSSQFELKRRIEQNLAQRIVTYFNLMNIRAVAPVLFAFYLFRFQSQDVLPNPAMEPPPNCVVVRMASLELTL